MASSFLGYKIGWKTIIAIVLGIMAFVLISVLFSGCDGKTDSGRDLPANVKKEDVDKGSFCSTPEIEAKFRTLVSGSGWHSVKGTKDGAVVYCGVDCPDDILATVNDAVLYSIAVQKAQNPTWTNALSATDWHIWFLPADGITPQGKVPFLNIRGVMSAGTVTQCNFNYIVLPDHSGIQWADKAYLFNSVFNEGEHLREMKNDPELAKQYFIAQDIHPHRQPPADIPKPDYMQGRGLLSRQAETLACGF